MLQNSIVRDKMAHSSNTVAQSVLHKMTMCTLNKVVHSGRLHYIPKYNFNEVIFLDAFVHLFIAMLLVVMPFLNPVICSMFKSLSSKNYIFFNRLRSSQ
jgi:hypothetical protein